MHGPLWYSYIHPSTRPESAAEMPSVAGLRRERLGLFLCREHAWLSVSMPVLFRQDAAAGFYQLNMAITMSRLQNAEGGAKLTGMLRSHFVPSGNKGASDQLDSDTIAPGDKGISRRGHP